MLGPNSLFAKVVHRVLTPEQREEYEAAEAERRKTRHAAKVRLFVAILEQSCPLKSSQRDALVDLLLKETQPALRSSEYDWYVVIVQAAKIPDSKLKPILDKAQMTFVKKITGQARGMEAHAQTNGSVTKKVDRKTPKPFDEFDRIRTCYAHLQKPQIERSLAARRRWQPSPSAPRCRRVRTAPPNRFKSTSARSCRATSAKCTTADCSTSSKHKPTPAAGPAANTAPASPAWASWRFSPRAKIQTSASTASRFAKR